MRKVMQFILSYLSLAAWGWLLWVGMSVDKSFADNAIVFGVVTVFMLIVMGLLAWIVDFCTISSNVWSNIEKKYLKP